MATTYNTGLRNVGSYQVSGTPFVTGSQVTKNKVQMIEFPYVTKAFTIWNLGPGGNSPVGDLRIHFNSGSSAAITKAGADGEQNANEASDALGHMHYISLNYGSGSYNSHTFNVKCKRVYVSTIDANLKFQISAELTQIKPESMYRLTGSGITE